MRAPAIGVAIEQMQRAVDVGLDDVGVDEQGGGEDVVEVFHDVGGVEGVVADHHFVAHGEMIPINGRLLKVLAGSGGGCVWVAKLAKHRRRDAGATRAARSLTEVARDSRLRCAP